MHFPKQLLTWLPLSLLLLVATACDRDEIDVAANTDFPPSIVSATPSADGRVVAGDFDIRVVFADGRVSPLQSATVTLMDSAMTEITTVTKQLSGIQDSLVIQGSEFGAADLGEGTYNMTISVTDARGQTTEQSLSFQISNLAFPANEEAVYIAGAFNGWTPSSNQLTLVGPNMWEIQGVDLQGGEWKLVDGPEFGGEDWGDGDCDGFMESNQNGGNENTACGTPAGLVDIRFNDQTLSYTVAPQVTFAANTMSLYLLGTFNTFSGGDYQLNLTGDNTWTLDEIELSPGDQFKFAEMPDFQGTNYGDDDNDGVAQVGGSNIVVADSLEEGFYSITFNDQTLEYSIEFLRPLVTLTSIGILGTALPNGFDSDYDLIAGEDGNWSRIIGLNDGAVKFRSNDEWTVNWGAEEFPSGTGTQGGPDIEVTAGIYIVAFNSNTAAYSFTPATLGLIGTATTIGNFDSDVDMERVEDGFGLVTLTTDLNASTDDEKAEVKFRVNDDWAINWGGEDFPTGTGVLNGPNIEITTAGTYTVTFDVNTNEYNFQQ